jgi:hypothetical protein
VHKSEKKEVCGQPAVEARARAHDGSRSIDRWGAPAEQGEADAGSGHGRRPLPQVWRLYDSRQPRPRRAGALRQPVLPPRPSALHTPATCLHSVSTSVYTGYDTNHMKEQHFNLYHHLASLGKGR